MKKICDGTIVYVFLSLSLFVVHDLVKLSLSLFFFSCCATVCGELKMNITWSAYFEKNSAFF